MNEAKTWGIFVGEKEMFHLEKWVMLALDGRWFIYVTPKKIASSQFAERKLLENFLLTLLSLL